MRVAVFAVLIVGLSVSAQEEVKVKKPARRYGFDVDPFTYPQKTPVETMKSIGTAFDRKRIDYMLAHMVDPKYVDYWAGQYAQAFTLGSDEGRRLLGFDRLGRETSQYYQDDPIVMRELRTFAKEADWEEKDDVAIGSTKAVPARKVYLRRVDDRWFLENRQQ